MGFPGTTSNAGFGPRFFAPTWMLAATLGMAAAQTPPPAPAGGTPAPQRSPAATPAPGKPTTPTSAAPAKPAAPKPGPGTPPASAKPAPAAPGTTGTKPAAAPSTKPAVPAAVAKPAAATATQASTSAPKPAPAQALLPGEGQATNDAIRKRLSNAVDPALREKYRRGDLGTALAGVQSRLATATNDTAHLFFRATIQGHRGDLPAALQDLERVIRNEPKWADAYLARGEFLYRAGKNTEAVPDFQRARALNPDDGLGPFMEYLCQSLDGKAAEAERLRSALSISRENPAYYFIQAARAFQQGEPEKGLYLYQAALDLYPEPLTAPFRAPFQDQGWIATE